MQPDDAVDELLRRIAELPPTEKQEAILQSFTGLLAGMDVEIITQLREQLVTNAPPSAGRRIFEEVIDGHLALRRLRDDGEG